MKIGRGMAVQRHLGQLFEGQSVAGLGEVQLLERFVERRDEPAFAALVARHGPMVLGVCRRILADPHDVEDAFQATFLVLVRRAGSLRDRDRLAPWLFGVARKVATRARLDLSRRKARESPGDVEFATVPGLDDHKNELGRVLIDEIDRLPGSLRDPIVLCCVEDLTYDEAAERLGTTAPAIRGRLARARERLRDRLTRRGFAPTAGALGVLLSTEVASAAVPNALLMTTTKASIAGTIPVAVEALAEGVIRTMILTKSKILAAAVVACGVAGSSMGVGAQDPGDSPSPRASAAPRQASPDADRLDQVEKKLDRVLKALEGGPDRTLFGARPAAPAVPSVPPVAPIAAIAPVAPLAPVAPQPPPIPAHSRAFESRPSIAQTRTRVETRRAGPDAPAFVGSGEPRDHARLDEMERKLERIEARLANLERRAGGDRTSDNLSLPEPDPVRSTRSRSSDGISPAKEGDPSIPREPGPPSAESSRAPRNRSQPNPNPQPNPDAQPEAEARSE